MPASPPTDDESKIGISRIQAALQRAHDGSRDPGRMPIHSQHATERLEPEWITEAGEKAAYAILENDMFGDGSAELRHTIGEPRRDMPAM